MLKLSFVLCLAACDSGGIVDCDPTMYQSDCSARERCDATTKKCEAVKDCTSSSECGGYACSASSVCERNCTGQTSGGDDTRCDVGYKCNPTTLACAKATTCNPAN